MNKQTGFVVLVPLIAIAAVGLTGLGTVIAVENSKPGDVLFPVKQTVQKVTHPFEDNSGSATSQVEIRSQGGESENRGPEADLRGSGSTDDNSVLGNSQDDTVEAVTLRGDGTVDDNSVSSSVSGSGQDDMVNGVKLRGDNSVDDNSQVGKNRGSSMQTSVDDNRSGSGNDSGRDRSGDDRGKD